MTSILQQLGQTIGGEFSTVRASLFSVQSTANNALPESKAISDYATKASLGNYALTSVLGDYSTSNAIANTYATQTELTNYLTSATASSTYATLSQFNNIDVANVSASIFTANNISADLVSINTLNATNASISNTISAPNINALQALSALRADIGTDGSSDNALTVDGSADIKGKLICDSLEVQGSTTIVNTQTVEVSDNFIELNKSSTGTVVAQESGIEINRGSTVAQLQIIDLNDNSFYPDFEWDGSTLADYAVQNGETTTGDPKPLYVSKGNGHANTNNYQIIWYSNPSSSNMGGTLDTTNPTWIMIEPGAGVDADFSGGSSDISNGSVAFPSSGFNVTQSSTGGEEDKAKVYWDNINERWHFKKGSADAQLYTGGLYSESAYVKVGLTYEELATQSATVSNSSLGTHTDFTTAFDIAKV